MAYGPLPLVLLQHAGHGLGVAALGGPVVVLLTPDLLEQRVHFSDKIGSQQSVVLVWLELDAATMLVKEKNHLN